MLPVRWKLATKSRAFRESGLEEALSRADRYCVVQPGVEFDHTQIILISAAVRPGALRIDVLADGSMKRMHSTDYQTRQAYRAPLVRDHYAILKVGLALTFAKQRSHFRNLRKWKTSRSPGNNVVGYWRSLMKLCINEPGYWKKKILPSNSSQRWSTST